ncbi:transposase [Streptomyces sp. NPDC004728]|uniref:transposase n=1 Tax=Streptomyces sp. NPDC004728 TaxID=3154289 RepID=UPI0033AEE3DF
MPRHACLTERQWDRIRPLLPSSAGRRGRPWAEHRRIVEAIVYRYRTVFLGGTSQPGSDPGVGVRVNVHRRVRSKVHRLEACPHQWNHRSAHFHDRRGPRVCEVVEPIDHYLE